MTATLHYIYDPLCGWCYGAEPLVTAAADVPRVALALHAGGLWPEPTILPAETRSYIQGADARIAEMSGQPFGEAYLNSLLMDPRMVLESRPPITAILAAGTLEDNADWLMLRAIQHAHYEHGRRVVEFAVLSKLAAECGLNAAEFSEAFQSAEVDKHIGETRKLMVRIGAGGFPTFSLELDGQRFAVPQNQFAADPQAFASWLTSRVEAASAA